MPVDPTTGKPTSTDPADFTDLKIPLYKTESTGAQVLDASGSPIQLASVGVDSRRPCRRQPMPMAPPTCSATWPLPAFRAPDGLRQMGDSHWRTSKESGQPMFGAGNNGLFGAVRSGMIERSNVDITEELVALISAQRNFQANAKAIEAASTITQAITNLRT